MLTPGVETPGYRLSIYGLVNLTRMIVATPADWFSSFELKYKVFIEALKVSATQKPPQPVNFLNS